jgi:hypothetical protein
VTLHYHTRSPQIPAIEGSDVRTVYFHGVICLSYLAVYKKAVDMSAVLHVCLVDMLQTRELLPQSSFDISRVRCKQYSRSWQRSMRITELVIFMSCLSHLRCILTSYHTIPTWYNRTMSKNLSSWVQKDNVLISKYNYVPNNMIGPTLEMGRYMPVHHTGTSSSSWTSYRHLSIYTIAFFLFCEGISCVAFKKYTGTSEFPFRALYKPVSCNIRG